MSSTTQLTSSFTLPAGETVSVTPPWPDEYDAGYQLMTPSTSAGIQLVIQGTLNVSDINGSNLDPAGIGGDINGIGDWTVPFLLAPNLLTSTLGQVTIASGGQLNVTVSVTALNQPGAVGFNSALGYYNFENDGTVTVVSSGPGVGVSMDGIASWEGASSSLPAEVVNTGTISVSASYGEGVQLGGDATLTNSGLITASGGAEGVNAQVAVDTITINNSGAITLATGASSVEIASSSPISGSTGHLAINNSGVITADTAISAVSGGAFDVTVHNTGTLNGNVVIGAGGLHYSNLTSAQIYNSGHINGAVGLYGEGVDIYDGRGGTLSGPLNLGDGTYTIYLGNDGETVHTGGGVTTVQVGSGADVLDGTLNGANGVYNTLSFAAAATGVTFNMTLQGQAQNTGDGIKTVTNFENVTGSAFIDHITGDAQNNLIDAGGGGDDVIDGGGGFNTLSYQSATQGVSVSLALQGAPQQTGIGNQTLSNFTALTGSAYSDHLTGDANDNVINGGAGGNDVLDGGGGVNIVSFSLASTGVDVSLALQGQAQYTGVGWDTLTNFQSIFGSDFNDILAGDSGNNIIDGSGGINTVSYAASGDGVNIDLWNGTASSATQGNDLLANIQSVIGSTYNDFIIAGPQSGSYDGGGGTNSLDFQYNPNGMTIDLGAGTASDGHITDALANIQNVIGTGLADTLEGGGSASSSLTGGGGADTFVYRSGDGNVTITDFSASSGDVIDLSSISGFYSLANVLADATRVGADTVITVGSGSLRLQGVGETSLTAADFHLAPLPNTATGNAANNFTATFTGALRQYTIGADGATITGGPDNAADSLINVQRLQFVDGYEAYSTTDTAAEVYRLYEATLNRAPDQEGLTGWTNALNNGTSLQSVANGFVSSAEFQADYGALDNTHFINLLYENVLHRAPDSTGQSYWLGQMSGGMSQAQVVLGFSQSPEDINDLAAPVQQGLWVGNPNAAEVARLYDTTLGRLPDAAGLAYWTNQLQTGTSLQTVVNGFVGSSEFQTDYGPLDNTHFVSLLYNNVLHRAPDPAGQSYWLGQMSSGMSRAQVVLGFSDSAEHIADTAPHIDGGIWLA